MCVHSYTRLATEANSRALFAALAPSASSCLATCTLPGSAPLLHSRCCPCHLLPTNLPEQSWGLELRLKLKLRRRLPPSSAFLAPAVSLLACGLALALPQPKKQLLPCVLPPCSSYSSCCRLRFSCSSNWTLPLSSDASVLPAAACA